MIYILNVYMRGNNVYYINRLTVINELLMNICLRMDISRFMALYNVLLIIIIISKYNYQ